MVKFSLVDSDGDPTRSLCVLFKYPTNSDADWMSIVIVILCIVLLILLITWLKINAFIAFLITSITAGLLLGIEPAKMGKVLEKGVGDMLGSLVIVIIGGAMLGKLVAETGAAQRIAQGLMKAFEKNISRLP